MLLPTRLTSAALLSAGILIVIATVAPTDVIRAQADETLVSKFRLDLSGAWGGWHSQLTQFGEQNAVMHGGYGGLEFNKTVFLGWAAYGVRDEVTVGARRRQVDFNYNGPVIAYTPLARRVVHPKFGLQVGFGKVVSSFKEGEPAETVDRVAVIQPSIGGEINVLRWFRLGADAGYRFGLNADDALGEDYASGFFATASLKFGFSWGPNPGGDGIEFD